MYEKRLVHFYKLQDVIQEGRQRNLWTEQARRLPHQRKDKLPRSAGSHFLYAARGNLGLIQAVSCYFINTLLCKC